jgi:Taurine catabolism dioxygenase TauD, TfdA family
VTPRLGAEIDGIDLSRRLSNRQVDELHGALAEHQVLFFCDQTLDDDNAKSFGRRFGDLHIHPNPPGPEGHCEILPIHADANAKRIAGARWHSDVSCDPEPPLGSILHLHTSRRSAATRCSPASDSIGADRRIGVGSRVGDCPRRREGPIPRGISRSAATPASPHHGSAGLGHRIADKQRSGMV